MDILMHVHHEMEGVSENPRALLRVNIMGLRKLIAQIEQTAALKATDDSIYCIERWDHSILWFDTNAALDEEYLDPDELDEKGYVEIDETLANQIQQAYDLGYTYESDGGAEIRTECNIRVTSDDSVHWTANLKHCDVVLETSSISLDALREYLDTLDDDDDSEEFSYPSGDPDRERFGNE